MRLAYLNLVGDGDDIAAVQEVEREFDIRLHDDCVEQCWTVGQLYDCLIAAVPAYLAKQPSTWRRFCWALCQETGDDPDQIGPETTLLSPAARTWLIQLHDWFARSFGWVQPEQQANVGERRREPSRE